MDSQSNIDAKKHLSKIHRQSQISSKPDKCILCEKPQTSFCNSHLIPQMVLKNISDQGKLLHSNAVVRLQFMDIEKGINNSGTFHFICKNCDGTLFQDYENPLTLSKYPSDKMLAEIALKNMILLLSRRNEEKALYDILQSEHQAFENKELLDDVHSLDIKDFSRNMDLYKNIIKNNISNCFQVVFWKNLPYVVPIAVQTPITLYKDMYGNIVNDVFDMSSDIEMQDLHLCIFPLETESIILCFYHRKNKNYRQLRHQFNSTSEEKCIEFINYLIFAYSEHYFCAKTIKELIENSPALQKLSQESYGNPNFGYTNSISMFINNYIPIKPNQIPNLLLEKYKLS